jgi:hypothetical protein
MDALEASCVVAYANYRAGDAHFTTRSRELGIVLVRLHERDHHQGARDNRSFAAHLRVLGIPRAVGLAAKWS